MTLMHKLTSELTEIPQSPYASTNTEKFSFLKVGDLFELRTYDSCKTKLLTFQEYSKFQDNAISYKFGIVLFVTMHNNWWVADVLCGDVLGSIYQNDSWIFKVYRNLAR